MTIDIDGILAGAIERGELVGAAAAVATPDGISTGAAGQAGPDRPWAADTVCWIASMTKAVTAVAVMTLVEAGKVDLDAPCGDLVPYLGAVQVFEGYDRSGRPVLRPPTRPVTLRRLLTHTSGFGYEFSDPRLADFADRHHLGERAEGSRASYEQPLLFDPGDEWRYGIGIDWAGQVIEAVTGTRADEFVTDTVIKPLGMADSRFYTPPDRPVATMYRRRDGGFFAVDWSVEGGGEMVLAGGAMYSTVVDYLRFTRMILGGGELDGVRILAPETVADMARNHAGDVAIRGWRSVRQQASNDVEFPGGSHHWGLSFLINPEPYPHGRSAGSLAWGGLANTYFWIDRSGQRAGVFATQVLPFWDRHALEALRAVERAAYS